MEFQPISGIWAIVAMSLKVTGMFTVLMLVWRTRRSRSAVFRLGFRTATVPIEWVRSDCCSPSRMASRAS